MTHETRTDEARDVWSLDRPQISLSTAVAGAEQVTQRLRTLATSVGPSAQAEQFYVRARTKAVDSIVNKVKLKRSRKDDPDPDYSFRQLTDLVGFRIVTLFDHQIERAIDFIFDLVEAGAYLHDPLFDKGPVSNALVEALFVPRSKESTDVYRMAQEFFVNKLREKLYASGINNEDEVERIVESKKIILDIERDTEYSSAHIMLNSVSYFPDFELYIPLEIQVRTAAEDIWAELSHKLLYKSSDPYVWSYEYQRKRLLLEAKSADIKQIVNNLPKDIIEFHTLSRDAQESLEIWNSKTSQRIKEKMGRHSYCLAMVYYIGDMDQGDLGEISHKYIDILSSLNGFIEKEVGTKVELTKSMWEQLLGYYRSARNCLSQWIGDFKKNKVELTEELRKVGNETASDERSRLLSRLMLVRERIYLVQLEELRIRADAFLYCEMDVRSGERVEVGISRERMARQLYSEFCEFADRHPADEVEVKEIKELKVGPQLHPRSMILYWKHLLAARFDGYLPEKNIVSAYQELQFDKTVPEWSIYQVDIPRALAVFLFGQVQDMLSGFQKNSEGLRRMSGLRELAKDKLVESLRLLLDCEAASRETDHRRGDIRLGFRPNENIIDVTLIIDVCVFFHQYFNDFLIKERYSLKKRVEEAVKQLSREAVECNAATKASVDETLWGRDYVLAQVKVPSMNESM